MKNKKLFNFRAFISLYMTIAFIIMTISGTILYIAPPGRIAHWSYWAMLGFTKDEWQAFHIMFTFIFVLAGILHIIYNWKPLIKYISNKMSGTSTIRKELIYSVIFSAFIFAGTYTEIPPFSTVLDFGESITDSWSDESTEPPVPHAEELTLSEISTQVNLKTQQLMQKLNKNGFSVSDSNQTLQEIAEHYNVVPSDIYKVINLNLQKSKSSVTNTKYTPGSGYGRKLLSEVFNENSLSWEEGIQLLKKSGILVSEDGKLKDIATENGKLPVDIINAINK